MTEALNGLVAIDLGDIGPHNSLRIRELCISLRFLMGLVRRADGAKPFDPLTLSAETARIMR